MKVLKQQGINSKTNLLLLHKDCVSELISVRAPSVSKLKRTFCHHSESEKNMYVKREQFDH